MNLPVCLFVCESLCHLWLHTHDQTVMQLTVVWQIWQWHLAVAVWLFASWQRQQA